MKKKKSPVCWCICNSSRCMNDKTRGLVNCNELEMSLLLSVWMCPLLMIRPFGLAEYPDPSSAALPIAASSVPFVVLLFFIYYYLFW